MVFKVIGKNSLLGIGPILCTALIGIFQTHNMIDIHNIAFPPCIGAHDTVRLVTSVRERIPIIASSKG
jgi:hypothetical protein